VIITNGIVGEVFDEGLIDIHVFGVVVQDVVDQFVTVCVNFFGLLLVEVGNINFGLLRF
jgi:hypothetical protein